MREETHTCEVSEKALQDRLHHSGSRLMSSFRVSLPGSSRKEGLMRPRLLGTLVMVVMVGLVGCQKSTPPPPPPSSTTVEVTVDGGDATLQTREPTATAQPALSIANQQPQNALQLLK